MSDRPLAELTNPTVSNASVQPTTTYDAKYGRYADSVSKAREGRGHGQQVSSVSPFTLRG